MSITPIKILIVEDEHEDVSPLSVSLLNEGFILYQASTKQGCLSSIEKYTPDIVILDEELADGNGVDLCRQLKSDPRTYSLFVILCASTKTRASYLFAQLKDLADGYFTKAAEPWEILSSIYSIIKLKEKTNSFLEQQQVYTSLFAYHPDAVYAVDLAGNFTSVNTAATTLTGYSSAQLLSMSFVALIAPDQLSLSLESFEGLLKGEPQHYNAAILHKEGHRVEINITGIPILVNEEVMGIYGISKDITSAVRLEKIAQAENKVLELAFTGSSLVETLTFLINSIEEVSMGMMGSIMLLEEDGKRLRTAAAPSLAKGYIDYINGGIIGPEAGSCGTAVYLKESVFVSDISQDKRWKHYKDIALEHGLKACFSFPILSSTHDVLGALACYYKQVNLPDKNDIQLIERAVNIAGILIERDKSQKQIHRKEEQLEEISTFLPGALYQFQMKKDGTMRFLYFSPMIKEVYGISPEEIYNDAQSVLKGVHPEDRVTFYDSIQVSARTMQPWLLDYRMLPLNNENGEIRWMRGHSIPKKQNDGSIIWYGLITDITGSKKAEETLRMLSRAVESAAEGIVVTDANMDDNPIIYANERFLKDTGYTREEVMGRNCRFLQGTDTDKNTVNKIRKAIEEKTHFIGEIFNYKKDGTPFWNLLVIAPVLDKEGKASHFVGLTNDISERKKGEEKLVEQNEELKKINQELDHFVYRVSHNLRAPLTSILGLITITKLTGKRSERDSYLSLMEKSIDKLDATIVEINAYAKNARLELQLDPIDFPQLITQVIEELSYMEEAKGIDLKVDIEDSVEYYSDESRLQMVLSNLLSNAIKYHDLSKSNPYIHIQVKVNPHSAMVSISDNGIGIGEEHQEKVFNMFYRASAKSSGSGLGLYIVKENIVKMKGTIKLRSTLYQGSEISIVLPNLKNSANLTSVIKKE